MLQKSSFLIENTSAQRVIISGESGEETVITNAGIHNMKKADHRVADEEKDVRQIEDQMEIKTWQSKILQIADANFIPDDLTHMKGIHIFESMKVVRLLKFVICTLLSMLTMHAFIRLVNWEHDEYYSMRDFYNYEFGTAVLYTTFLGIVARVQDKKGCDRLSFLLPLLLVSILTSASTNIKFLRNSITFYNVACTWKWQLYLVISIVLLLLVWIFYLHIRNAYRDGSLIPHLVEIFLIVLFFIVPKVTHSHFHLHHYYSFWMLGMIFNRKEWYDQVMFLICLGQFVNGISVYGIDPVETCSYVLHASVSNNCVSVRAGQDEIQKAIDFWGNKWIEYMLGNGTDVCFGISSSVAPDPSNCTSERL
jgi:hypothetical protein